MHTVSKMRYETVFVRLLSAESKYGGEATTAARLFLTCFTRLSYVCSTFLCVLLDCSHFVYFYVYFMYLLVSMCV